ncbi:MAG: hypothetical protein ACI8ZM_003858 [Crocinitomix sp.]|jgi:hypothetical protein
MKNNIFFLLTGITLFFSCKSDSPDVQDESAISETVKYTLNLVSFSEEQEYSEFSDYDLTQINNPEAITYDYDINFIGEKSGKVYFYFGVSTLFEAFNLDEALHWIPTRSDLTVSLDTNYFDYILSSSARFSAYTSKDHWSRKSRRNGDSIVNKISVNSHISITNTKFISGPKTTLREDGYIKSIQSSRAERPGDIYGFSINNDYECDTLIIRDALSGDDSFLRFLNEIYQPDEQIIRELPK